MAAHAARMAQRELLDVEVWHILNGGEQFDFLGHVVHKGPQFVIFSELDPDRDRRYFDRQDYRHQTIQIPGVIRPEETYELLDRFYSSFEEQAGHSAYRERMTSRHPDTKNYFDRLSTPADGHT